MTASTAKTLLQFEEIFNMHYKMLCNAANKILNDKDAAEDVVQDVFLKFWAKRESIDIIQSIKSYLYRATINTSLNYLESNKKIIRLQNTDLSNESFIINGGENFNQKELENKIDEAINKLPPKCKVVFVLSRYEGMKYQQIADHLGISIKTVENQMGKALKMLREQLKPFLTQEFITIAGTIGLAALLSFLSLLIFITHFQPNF